MYTEQALQNKLCNSNDFYEYALTSLPQLREYKEKLLDHKAYAIGLSGSGSCLYGLFHSQLEAKQALISIKQNTTNLQGYTCQSLSHFSYY